MLSRRAVVRSWHNVAAIAVVIGGCSSAPPSPKSAPVARDPKPAVVKPRVYFATGHGERAEATQPEDGRGVKALRRLVERTLHATTHELPFAAASGVPSDAAAFFVIGPSRVYAPEEVAAVKQYADRGGKLLLALDPEAHVDLAPLAGVVGISWAPKLLVNARSFAKRHGDVSDRANLVTNRFSDHPSVAALKRNVFRSAVVVPGGAALGAVAGTPMKIDFTLLAFLDTFQDDSGDFTFQEGETKTGFNLVAAVTSAPPAAPAATGTATPEMRAIVAGDADFVSDAALGLGPNVALAREALRWLGEGLAPK